MKRIVSFFLFLLFIYIVYYDLKVGTLPTFQEKNVMEVVAQKENTNSTENDIQYVTKEVKQGETVLSIVEQLHKESVPVPIDTIVSDFERLNENTKANKIIIGQTYKFPMYK
ncbi:hypothetical protein [Bacillus sp. FJAT-47783]|uniref:hypothetical protein n=1 Tax=Bacillus sp. FJAT-47783 TaxID=2922712 RepID=UPI001FADB0C9|nr:hypothetical protein [Bacillus sp. FJAT-47783]